MDPNLPLRPEQRIQATKELMFELKNNYFNSWENFKNTINKEIDKGSYFHLNILKDYNHWRKIHSGEVNGGDIYWWMEFDALLKNIKVRIDNNNVSNISTGKSHKKKL